MIETPECEKMAAVRERSQAIGEFVEWLGMHGTHLMRWRTDLTDRRRCWNVYEGDEDDPTTHARRGCTRCDGTGWYEVTGIEGWVPRGGSIEELLAEFFEIDLDKVEVERRAVLASLQDRL